MRQHIRGGTVTLKHIQTIRQPNGKVRRYLRIPGQTRIALPDLDPSDPAFILAYAEAVAAAPKKPRHAVGTIHAAVEVCKRGLSTVSPVYRSMMTTHLDAIAAKAGAAKAADLRTRHIEADLAKLEPHAALKRLKAWRLLTKTGLFTGDPAKGIARPRPPRSDGHETWTDDDVAAFRATWPIGTVQRRAFELLLWTGARISDAVRLGPGMVGRDGVLSYRQAKTGGEAFVPMTCAQPAFAGSRADLDAALTPNGQMTYLATAQGRGRSHKALGGLVSEAAQKAGIDKTAHGLRKTRARTLAEGGASTHQIASWTGHKTLAEVQHYTDAADRRKAVIGTEQDRNTVNTGRVNCK